RPCSQSLQGRGTKFAHVIRVASFKGRPEATGGTRDYHFGICKSAALFAKRGHCGFEASALWFRGFPMDPLNKPTSPVHAESGALSSGEDERKSALSRAGEARRRFLIETGVLTTALAAAPSLDAAPPAQPHTVAASAT